MISEALRSCSPRKHYHCNVDNGPSVMQGDGPIGGSILIRPEPKIDAVAVVLAC